MFGSLLRTVASARTTIVVATLVFGIGTGFGIWLTNKVYTAGKIGQLENYIDKQAEVNRRTTQNLSALYEGRLKNAKARVEIKKVIEYVKDNRECDISADTEQLLDLSRTGMSYATGRADEGLPGLAPITQRQQIESCARDGNQYKELKLNYDALKQFVLDTRNKK